MNNKKDFYWKFTDYMKWDCIFCSLSNCKHTDCMRHLNGINYREWQTTHINKEANIIDFNGDNTHEDSVSCTSYAR